VSAATGGRPRVAAAVVVALLACAGCGHQSPSLSVAPDPVVERSAMQLTCGYDPFPAAALSGPLGAEKVNDPAAAALRAFVILPPTDDRPALPRAGYRRLTNADRTAEFAASSADFDAPLAHVRVVETNGRWFVEDWGGCRPQVVFEGLHAAVWDVAPDVPFPNPRSTSVTAMVNEMACTGGLSADGRVLPPLIIANDAEVVIIFAVRLPPPTHGAVSCPGPPPTRVEVQLGAPLGPRTLLDGSTVPPRDPIPHPVPIDVDPIH
jgi:hypothetical protein